MKNITLALDEKIIKKGRKYASRHNLTLNSLVRKLLEQTIEEDSQNWLELPTNGSSEAAQEYTGVDAGGSVSCLSPSWIPISSFIKWTAVM